MPTYYLLVDNRLMKSSAALDQLKEFALTTFSSTSSNLGIQDLRFKNLATEITRTRHFIDTIALARSGFDLTNRPRANTSSALRHYRSPGLHGSIRKTGRPLRRQRSPLAPGSRFESGIAQRFASSISRADRCR
jgi:hypothetical protein